MRLVEQGRLRLDDPVPRRLPELANRQVLHRLDGDLEDTVPTQALIRLEDPLTLRLGFGLSTELFTVDCRITKAGQGSGGSWGLGMHVPAAGTVETALPKGYGWHNRSGLLLAHRSRRRAGGGHALPAGDALAGADDGVHGVLAQRHQALAP